MARQRHASAGFTLIEIIIIIAMLAILVGLTYYFAGNWRTRAATTEVKSDLQGAATALENYRNFGTSYPASLTTAVFKPTGTVDLDYTYRSGDGSYCLNGSSKVVASVNWHIDSRVGKEPAAGACT